MIHSSDILKSPILIVDDQQANVLLLEQMLRRAGYLAIHSTMVSGQVCELHRVNRYSVILLDLEMPGMDGFQVMEGLKAIETGGYIPVLVITAEPKHKLRALKAGARDFVSKPLDLVEVLMRVRNMIEVLMLRQQVETRAEQAEAHFIEAQKMQVIGQLAGGVAHDFNNILSVIMGYNHLMGSMIDKENTIQQYSKEIGNAARRAAVLIGQLLIFSRKQTVQLVVLDVNEVIQEWNKMLFRLIGANIEMTVVPGTQIGRVKADAGYVGQLLMNLVVNARDAMPNGGKLTIATRSVTVDETNASEHPGAMSGCYVMLSVSDTGTGMTDEVKARLFEAFFTTKPKGKGTGLGLATCQTIVQQFGSHIAVSSELGKGSTFNIYFPLVEQFMDVADVSAQTGPLPRGTETLMVVEDDHSLRLLARSILEEQGYQVLSATNGQDALNVVLEHKGSPIGLVFTDVIMPVMGGKVMAEWFTKNHPHVKILFTSGYIDEAIAQLGALVSSGALLPKPYTPENLARKVRQILDNGSASHSEALNGTCDESIATSRSLCKNAGELVKF